MAILKLIRVGVCFLLLGNTKKTIVSCGLICLTQLFNINNNYDSWYSMPYHTVAEKSSQ